MTRVLTAIVILALLLGALAAPPWVFFAGLAAVLLVAWAEFVRLARTLGCAPLAAPGALAVLATALAFAGDDPRMPMWVLLASALGLTLASLGDHRDDPAALVGALAATCAGVLWLGVLLGAQIDIRTWVQGERWLLLLYGCVALGDSAAYYGGSRFGRHKLAPALSPNKSVEGAIFGLAASALGAAALSPLISGLGAWSAAGLGLALGISGQVGDLIESSIKRAAGTKDSSTLLPGHGGVLDRIDAHLLAGAAMWVVLTAGWPL